MGMFDEIKCYAKTGVRGSNQHTYQTKDTPKQTMDVYEIRQDGSLWHEIYDGPEISERKPIGWERSDYSGEIIFYTNTKLGWLEFVSTFKNGELQKIIKADKS